MAPIVAPISSGVTVAGLQAVSAGYQQSVAFPLLGSNGIVGLIPSTAVGSIPGAQRPFVDADSLVVGWEHFISAQVNELVTDIVERAQAADKTHVLVYDELGRQAGYFSLNSQLSFQA